MSTELTNFLRRHFNNYETLVNIRGKLELTWWQAFIDITNCKQFWSKRCELKTSEPGFFSKHLGEH